MRVPSVEELKEGHAKLTPTSTADSVSSAAGTPSGAARISVEMLRNSPVREMVMQNSPVVSPKGKLGAIVRKVVRARFSLLYFELFSTTELRLGKHTHMSFLSFCFEITLLP